MDLYTNYSTDFYFDNDFGDMTIINDQVYIPKSTNKILKQVITDRIKSAINDYFYMPLYAANLDKYIGTGIDKDTIPDIENSIIVSLTGDNFLSKNSINIYSNIINNITYIRIFITTQDNTQLNIGITSTGPGDLTID